jgi:hypothetical protein
VLLDAHCSATWLGLPPWGATGQVLGPPRALIKGSVTERLLYIPVPASLRMQDVNRGEVAPWVMCCHREEHSKGGPLYACRAVA